MALTQCPECGEKLSTAATRCPHCGIEGASLGAAHEKKARQNFVVLGSVTCAIGSGMLVAQATSGALPATPAALLSLPGAMMVGGMALAVLFTRGAGEYISALIGVTVMAAIGGAAGLLIGGL